MGPFLIALGSLPVQKTSRECTSRIQPNEVPIGTSFPSLGISLLKGGSTTPLERERASLLNGLRYRGISERVVYAIGAVRREDFVPQSLRDSASVSYTHLRAHETPEHLVCRLLLEKKKKNK